ncbi:MAG: glutathione S-transferase family protein [Caulobacteraceae bacterium]|nr:glutathione S-transferase family protein [Caulobacteraceae bacterium]
MTEVVVHGVPGSPYVRSVLLALNEKGAPHRLAPMGLGQNRTPAHLARHPFGRIPVIDHGDFQLYETQAIIRYVDAVFPGPSLRPADPLTAARADQITGVVDCYLFPKVSAIIGFHRLIAPRLLGWAPDEAAIAAAVPDARITFEALNRLIGDNPFMVGEAISIADLMVVPHIDFLAVTPEGSELLEGTPLLAWLERMRARPSLVATTPERLGMAA